jgi:hypothetical protein
MPKQTTKSSKTFEVTREIATGRFVSVKESSRSSRTTIVGRDAKAGKFIVESYRVSPKSTGAIKKTSKKRSDTLEKLAKK